MMWLNTWLEERVSKSALAGQNMCSRSIAWGEINTRNQKIIVVESYMLYQST